MVCRQVKPSPGLRRGRQEIAWTISGGRPKPYVFRHHFHLLHVAKAVGLQVLDNFLYENLGCGCAGGQGHGIDVHQPCKGSMARQLSMR